MEWNLHMHDALLLTEFSCDMQYCSSNVVPWEHCHRKWIMAFPSNKTMLINTNKFAFPIHNSFSLVYLHLSDDFDSTLVNGYFEVSYEKHLIDCIFIHSPLRPRLCDVVQW